MLIGVSICIHYAEVMLGMLVQVLGGDPITARGGFASQGHISFKDLIGVPSNFDVWAITVESLNSVRHPRPIVMRIVAIIATA